MAAVAQQLRVAPGSEPDGMVTQGCELRGRIEYDGSLRIQGLVEGEIIAKDEVEVDTRGVARARIQAASIRVSGLVEGDLQAQHRVEITATGEVLGDIVTPTLKIEDGGTFEGRCRMGRRASGERKKGKS